MYNILCINDADIHPTVFINRTTIHLKKSFYCLEKFFLIWFGFSKFYFLFHLQITSREDIGKFLLSLSLALLNNIYTISPALVPF